MEFREATTADVEGIRAVAEASWQHDYPDIVSRETIDEGVDEWYAPSELEREIDEEDGLVVVAVEEDEEAAVVGFAHGVVTEDDGHVLRLYVDPDWRRQGIGGRLLDETAERFDERGVERLEAMVLTENETGRAFYQANGFEAIQDAYTTIGDERYDETIFERPLAVPVDSS